MRVRNLTKKKREQEKTRGDNRDKRRRVIIVIRNQKNNLALFSFPFLLVLIPALPPVLFWAASRATVSNFVRFVRFSMHTSRLPITAHAEKGNSQLMQCGPDPREQTQDSSPLEPVSERKWILFLQITQTRSFHCRLPLLPLSPPVAFTSSRLIIA